MRGWKELNLDEKFVLLVGYAANKTNRNGDGSFTVQDVVFVSANFPKENYTEEGIEIQRSLIVDGDVLNSYKFLTGDYS
jgi:hypothetical protein